MPWIRILRLRLRRNLVPMSPEVAGGRLHFDYLSAIVRQNHRCAWACDEAGQVHDFQSRKDIFTTHNYFFSLFVFLILMSSVLWSASLELCRPLFKESGRALLFVFCSRTKSEERSFECQALVLAGLHSFV